MLIRIRLPAKVLGHTIYDWYTALFCLAENVKHYFLLKQLYSVLNFMELLWYKK